MLLVAELPTSSYMISVDVFHDGGQCPSFVLFCSYYQKDMQGSYGIHDIVTRRPIRWCYSSETTMKINPDQVWYMYHRTTCFCARGNSSCSGFPSGKLASSCPTFSTIVAAAALVVSVSLAAPNNFAVLCASVDIPLGTIAEQTPPLGSESFPAVPNCKRTTVVRQRE